MKNWLLALILVPTGLFSQVTGNVSDKSTKTPIYGAKIITSTGEKVLSDVDGNFILEFDPVIATSPTISIDYYVSETGYEGDGTSNTSGSDRLRIYLKDLGNNMEYDLLNTTGNDINDLGIEGSWTTVSFSIEVENKNDCFIAVISKAKRYNIKPCSK